MKKNGKEFVSLSVDSIVKMLDDKGIRFDRMIVHDSFAMNLDMVKALAGDTLINRLRTPFHVSDIRIMRLVRGEVTMEVNFQKYTLHAGDIMMVNEDSYMELHEVSDDTKGQAIAFSPGKYQTNLQLYGLNTIIIRPTESEWEEISRHMYMIYSLAKTEPYRKDVVEPVVAALVNNILLISSSGKEQTPASAPELLFNRFMDELNRNFSIKLPASCYAEKLCVTPQYLSRVVSQISGRTVTQWINKAVVMKARICLRETSMTVSEVSDELGFPNDSFFCRFFKRETGQTPTAYRRWCTNFSSDS